MQDLLAQKRGRRAHSSAFRLWIWRRAEVPRWGRGGHREGPHLNPEDAAAVDNWAGSAAWSGLLKLACLSPEEFDAMPLRRLGSLRANGGGLFRGRAAEKSRCGPEGGEAVNVNECELTAVSIFLQAWCDALYGQASQPTLGDERRLWGNDQVGNLQLRVCESLACRMWGLLKNGML